MNIENKIQQSPEFLNLGYYQFLVMIQMTLYTKQLLPKTNMKKINYIEKPLKK